MLDLKLDRPPVPARDAATVIIARKGPSGGLEVFCVERSQQSRFLGGAIVFPGGKVEETDADAAWFELSTPPRSPEPTPTVPFARDNAHLRALAIAACRETLEEAALALVCAADHAGALPRVSHDEAVALSARARTAAEPHAIGDWLRQRSLVLDLRALIPFARWVTPKAESRRFDARFFLAIAPDGQFGAHDNRETSASFWSRPSEVLARFDAGEIQLAPPTHRSLMLLSRCEDVASAVALASATCLEPICPRLVKQPSTDAQSETLALTLPGDPEHEERTVRVEGPSRYVLRGERWLPEDAPR